MNTLGRVSTWLATALLGVTTVGPALAEPPVHATPAPMLLADPGNSPNAHGTFPRQHPRTTPTTVTTATAVRPATATAGLVPATTLPTVIALPNGSLVPVRGEGAPIPADARCSQWWDLAREAGWPETTLDSLDVVMHKESRCTPDVWNRDDPMGGSRGLLQLNGFWTRWLRERGHLETVEDLYTPSVNLRAGLAIYEYGIERYGFGWGPWGYRYVDPYEYSKRR